MKNIRVLGVDDAYFIPHKGGKTKLIGVVMRASFYIDGFIVREISVDGKDVTEAIASMVANSKYGKDVRILMTQGITFGGFNILDVEALYRNIEIPVLVVSRKMPDIKRMVDALKKHFTDWEYRADLLKKIKIEEIKNGRYKLYIQRVGMDREEATGIIRKFTLRGAMPEPLRIAHLVASALKLGESKGKA